MSLNNLIRRLMTRPVSSRTSAPIRKATKHIGRPLEHLEDRITPAFNEFLDPNPNPGNQFGGIVLPLSTGNVVVTSPFDDAGGTDAGAVYLFNGATGALISTLRGSSAGDRIGDFGVTALTNGNYVVISPLWDNGAAADAGAATWGSGTAGISGVVSAANSLVGTTASDQVGIFSGVVALSNGNYVVVSRLWDNGAALNAGAVTWSSGSTGISGPVSAANSLVGSTTADQVGTGVTPLSSGNYVVGSPSWDNGAAADAGAVTWGNGLGGTVGPVSAANSLVGTTAVDNVGSGGVTPLANGNYVVLSPLWDNGAFTNAGAVTWGRGTTGVSGNVSATNSVVGTSANTSAQFPTVDNTNDAFYARFLAETVGGRVRVGSQTTGFGTLSATLSGGNLTVADTAGFTNSITVSVSGANLVITDAVEGFQAAPAGGTLSNSRKTLTIPLASITGSLTLTMAGGNDTLTVNYGGGNFPFAINYAGGAAGNDKLATTGGTFAAATHTFTAADSGTISFTGNGLLSYSGLEPVDMSGTTVGNFVFNLPAGGSTAFLEDDGTSGNGVSQLRSSPAAFETTTFRVGSKR